MAMFRLGVALGMCVLLASASADAQQAARGSIRGRVTDETGGVLPGVTVALRTGSQQPVVTVTGSSGDYSFNDLNPGTYELSLTLINFASVNHRDLMLAPGATIVSNETMHLSMNADVVVIGKRTFTNLADVAEPAEDLVGIASSASQGAITAKQLDVRPFMRQGEVLETVPGVIITQHSGEGKANQYFLRGFNLDHGSDFAMTVAGAPVNMVTHAHSQGYSDLNFLIPELVAGVQYLQGSVLRGARRLRDGRRLEYQLRDGARSTDRLRRWWHVRLSAWTVRSLAEGRARASAGGIRNVDERRSVVGARRLQETEWRASLQPGQTTSTGSRSPGWDTTGSGAPPRRCRSGPSTPARSDASVRSIRPIAATRPRYSIAAEWQHGSGTTLNKIQAYGIWYDLTLVNNFTFYLDDPVHGDQNEQQDHRFVSGFKAFQKRLRRAGAIARVQNTFGVQLRNDDVMNVALYHTEKGVRLFTRTQDSALVTTAGVYARESGGVEVVAADVGWPAR